MKKWIIALVLILAVVIVFVACKNNGNEETPSQTPTQSTTEPVSDGESTDDELELVPGDDLIISDGEYNDDDTIIIGDGSSDSSGEDSISWEEIKGKKS